MSRCNCSANHRYRRHSIGLPCCDTPNKGPCDCMYCHEQWRHLCYTAPVSAMRLAAEMAMPWPVDADGPHSEAEAEEWDREWDQHIHLRHVGVCQLAHALSPKHFTELMERVRKDHEAYLAHRRTPIPTGRGVAAVDTNAEPSLYYTFDDTGAPHPCTFEEWVRFFSTAAHLFVERTTLRNPSMPRSDTTVSTIFFGTNINLESRPELWETIVNGLNTLDYETSRRVVADLNPSMSSWRWRSVADAREGHRRIVERLVALGWQEQEIDLVS